MSYPKYKTSRTPEQIVFSSTEYIASLKGLLKGKGGYEDSELLISHAKELKNNIIKLMEEFLTIVNMPPYTYFGTWMRIQHSGKDKNAFLRWRNADFTLMGVQVWKDAMLKVPVEDGQLLRNFKELELVRVKLNKHMSYLSMLIKQNEEYLENIKNIEEVFEKALKVRNLL